MFNGIRLQHFLFLMSLSFLGPMAHANNMKTIKDELQECRNRDGGNVLSKTPVGEADEVIFTSSDGLTVHKRNCYDYTCEWEIEATQGNETGKATTTQELKNSCVVTAHTQTVIRDDSRSGNSSSGSGDGSNTLRIRVDGKLITCNPQDGTWEDCLRANGLSGTYHIRSVDSDRQVISCFPGNSPDSGRDIEIISEVGTKCLVKKRVWWKLWLGKSWVESDDCTGDVVRTSRGSEEVIAIDIDREIERRSGGSGGSSGRRRDSDSDNVARYYYLSDSDLGIRIKCSINMDEDECLDDYYYRTGRSSRSDSDGCVACSERRRRGSSSRGSDGDSLSNIIAASGYALGNVLTPVMGYMGVNAYSKAMLKSNQAWADSCTTSQTSYINGLSDTLDWYSANETSVGSDYISSYYSNMPTCNGQAYGAYAGMQGFASTGLGTFGNFYSGAGYSNSLMGLYAGPYASPNYGLGVDVTGGLGSLYGNSIYGNGLSGSLGLNLGLNSGLNSSLYTSGINGLYAGTNMGINGLYNSSIYPQYSSVANGLVPWSTNGHYYTGSSNYSNIIANQSQLTGGTYYQQQALADQANTALQNYYNYPYANTTSRYYNSAAYSPFNLGLSLNAGLGVMI